MSEQPQPLHQLTRVEEQLAESIARLQPPLSDLVQGQIAAAQPHVRAAVVLAASANTAEQNKADERPVFLAAALEMLFIALNTHKLLLDVEAPDKNLLGGTILVGDYCFGQAADLAVRTQSPRVVTIFSDALKLVSEGNLRRTMANAEGKPSASGEFDENVALFEAGVRAASVLAEHSPAVQEQLVALGQSLAEQLQQESTPSLDLSSLSPSQQARWRAVIEMVT